MSLFTIKQKLFELKCRSFGWVLKFLVIKLMLRRGGTDSNRFFIVTVLFDCSILSNGNSLICASYFSRNVAHHYFIQ